MMLVGCVVRKGAIVSMPAIIREISCKSALNKTKIPGYDYCMNPYVGCTHGCVYCYASFMCRFTDHRENWGEFLDVKTNFPQVLVKQLGSAKVRLAGKVLLGTVTDAYLPEEARYRITRSSLEILQGFPELGVHILTKSILVERDVDILARMRGCEVGFTVTTMDPDISRVIEPGASLPRQRLDTALEIMKAGIHVWVFIAPVLPGLTDTEESFSSLFLALHSRGIRDIQVDCLNPYASVLQRLRKVYYDHFPQALPALERFLRDPGQYKREMASRIRRFSGR